MTSSKPITACQVCGASPLTSVLFVGYLPPVNTMPVVGTVPVEELAFPLEMMRCGGCELVQIGLDVDQNILFPPSYPYRSGSTKILRTNFANLAEEATAKLGLKPGDLVVDIGSNDGTLLSNFKAEVLGIEPSEAANDANEAGIRTQMSFFSQATATKARKAFGAAKLITAANVFAHITDVHAIIGSIVEFLDDDGVFISENHYLAGLVETLQYDTLYHEHLRYYHVNAMVPMFAKHGLEIFHVTKIPTHGGSIRVYTGRKGQHLVDPSVAAIIKEETDAGICDGSALETFRKRVVQSKVDLYAVLADIKRKGQKVYGIGAPSRASTLIKYVGLDDGLLDCVLEIASSPKVNKYMPGTRIPVLDEQKLFDDQPDYALLLSWHISDELRSNLRKKGFKGKFLLPLPEPHVID
jgi:hypothetical protein